MVRFLARKVKKYSIGVDFTRTQLLIKNISSVIGWGGLHSYPTRAMGSTSSFMVSVNRYHIITVF